MKPSWEEIVTVGMGVERPAHWGIKAGVCHTTPS
jgi:hypothetical protein